MVYSFRDDFFPNLLNNIFRLMPVEVLQDNKNKSVKLMEIFSTEPSLDFGGINFFINKISLQK